MTLRARLALAFALLAALPLVALTWPARRALDEAYDEAVSSRLAAAARAVERTVAEQLEQSRTLLEALPHQDGVVLLAQDGLALPDAQSLGAQLLAARSLDVLSLMDADGRVLTSGHLPARAGDLDPTAFALAEAGEAPHRALLPVRDGELLLTTQALVVGRRLDVGGVAVLGLAGFRLGDRWLARLAALTGANLQLVEGDGGIVAEAGSAPTGAFRVREVALPHGEGDAPLSVRLRLSTQGLAEAEQRLAESTGVLALVALLLASGLGALVAHRLTRPIDALARGTDELARGALDHRVEVQATGELGRLVSAFNHMAQSLSEATARAARAERVAAWEEVARRLAHELKNPLTPIRLAVETLRNAHARKHPRFAELFEESTPAILEEVDRLRRTLDGFSRFARLPALVLAEVELGGLIDQLLPLWREGEMSVEREGAATLTPLQADRDQLSQVLLNLVTNARQAQESRGRCVVRLLEPSEATVAIEVEDDGPGIPEAEQARVFQPYVTTKREGSGLGLAISRRIAEEHGGALELLPPTALRGARFRLTLKRG